MIIDELFTEFTLNALVISNAILLGAVAIVLLRFQERAAKLESRQSEPIARPVKTESVESIAQNDVLEQRILALQDIADELSRTLSLCRGQPACDSPYENAAQLVKRGASADDLTRNCGLNKGEAQLMVRLHSH